jgi:hypothetical protein
MAVRCVSSLSSPTAIGAVFDRGRFPVSSPSSTACAEPATAASADAAPSGAGAPLAVGDAGTSGSFAAGSTGAPWAAGDAGTSSPFTASSAAWRTSAASSGLAKKGRSTSR